MALDSTKIKKGARNGLIILIILSIAGLWTYTSMNFSKGARVGNIIKISKKGIVFKTFEGQLNLGANTVNMDSGTADSTWEFSVPKSNKEVLEAIDQSIIDGKRVKLYYKEKYVKLPWRGDTQYMVYKVDILKPNSTGIETSTSQEE